MELSKENLIKLIKEYSVPEFDKLNIYSMPYFHNILVNYYKDRDCNVIYTDFNKVNDANLKYGKKATDGILENSLACIREALPDADIVRLGGDEFLIIDESHSISEINSTLASLVKNELNQEGKTLSLTFGAKQSKKEDDFYEIYSDSEQIVDEIKLETKTIPSEDHDEILKFKMHENFKDFFDNFRFSNYFKFTNKNVQTVGNTAIDSAISLLTDQEYAKKLYEKREHMDVFNTNTYSIFTPEETNIIHAAVSGNDVDEKDLESIDSNKLNTFLDSLIRNPVTGYYNGFYFNKFFKEKANDNEYATVIKADVTGIKNCNTKYSHLDTDVMLKNLSDVIKSCFADKLNLDFDDKNFVYNEDANYMFDTGGGNFIILLKEHDLSFPEYLAGFNLIDKSAGELGIVSSYTNASNFSLDQTISQLNFDCDSKKISHKKSELKSDVSKEALDLFISDCVNYYLTHSENPNDLGNQQKFLSDLFDSVVDNAIEAGKKYEISKQVQKNEVYHQR